MRVDVGFFGSAHRKRLVSIAFPFSVSPQQRLEFARIAISAVAITEDKIAMLRTWDALQKIDDVHVALPRLILEEIDSAMSATRCLKEDFLRAADVIDLHRRIFSERDLAVGTDDDLLASALHFVLEPEHLVRFGADGGQAERRKSSKRHALLNRYHFCPWFAIIECTLPFELRRTRLWHLRVWHAL